MLEYGAELEVGEKKEPRINSECIYFERLDRCWWHFENEAFWKKGRWWIDVGCIEFEDHVDHPIDAQQESEIVLEQSGDYRYRLGSQWWCLKVFLRIKSIK